jgi:hypothetical protein
MWFEMQIDVSDVARRLAGEPESVAEFLAALVDAADFDCDETSERIVDCNGYEIVVLWLRELADSIEAAAKEE